MKKNLIWIINLIPWIYLIAYSFAIRGMAHALEDTQNGKLIPDPIYTNAELTMMLSFWVTFSLIVAGYVLIRYACRTATKSTMRNRIESLERRIEELESQDRND